MKTAIKAEMEAVASEIVSMMKSLAPEQSGDLRDSIGWTWGKRPKYSQVMAVAKASLAGEMTITIFAGNSKVRYAHLVEFGTAPHVIKAQEGKALGKGGIFGSEVHHPGATAKPFFYVSWRANKKKARSRIARATRKAAKEVAAGG